MRCALLPALLVTLAACTAPAPEAYLPGARGAAPNLVPLGENTRGEPCRMLRAGQRAEVLCGDWEAPSARLAEVPALALPALAEQARAALAGRLGCEDPAPTSVLASEPALLMPCRRRAGGWPSFLLVAAPGGRAMQVEGVLPALPAAERAMGILSGRLAADAPLPRSAALDLLATRLAQAPFGADDIARYEQLLAVGRDSNQAERFAAAETAYRGALAIQERLLGAGNPDSFAPLGRLALQVSNQGRYAEAEALLSRAARLAPRATDPLAVAQLAHYRGLHAANRSRVEEATAALAEAEARYDAALPGDLRGGAPAALASGSVLVDPVAPRALVGLLEARRNRAAVLRAAGRLQEAEEASARAAELTAATPGVVGTDLIAARLARTGGAVSASSGATSVADASFTRSALRFARGIPLSRPYADTLLLRAAAVGAAPASILPLCREAVAVLRRLREGTSPERIAPCIGAFAGAATAEARPTAQALLGEAFEAAQLAQGDVTSTQIARAAARLAEGARDPAVAAAIRRREDEQRTLAQLYRERDLAGAGRAAAAELAAIDARIATVQAASADADEAVQAAAPGYAQLVQSVASAAEVGDKLLPGEAMALIFLPRAGSGWTFLLLDGEIAAGRVGADGSEIAELVRQVRASVENGDDRAPFEAEAAWRLHRALFDGVAQRIATARRLVVAPSGPLLSIPFGMLVEAPPPTPRGHQGVAFLGWRVPVAHVPAAASFLALRRVEPSTAPRPWIGFGDPRPVPAAQASASFPAAPGCGTLLSDLPPLRVTGDQLRAARAETGAPAEDARSGAAFTLAAVQQARLDQYRVVHFATHGVLPRDLSCLAEPALVASVPPGARDAEGALLTSATVLNLVLNADTVVLAACNSGGGAAAGESLSSLARAFFYAGARSLLVTHWYVNEVAAAQAAVGMLSELRRTGDAPEALRAAQMRLVQQVPRAAHPAYWAPFALIGAGPSRTATAARGSGPAS
jgi:CHAT domain-containing protein